MPRVALSFSGQSWIAQLTPTAAEGEAQLGSRARADLERPHRRELSRHPQLGADRRRRCRSLIALLLSYLLAKGILRPVRTMAAGGRAGRRGQLQDADRTCTAAMNWRVCRARSIRCCRTCAKRATSKAMSATCRASCRIPAPKRFAQRRSPTPEPPPREPARAERVAVLGLEFRQFGDADARQPPSRR